MTRSAKGDHAAAWWKTSPRNHDSPLPGTASAIMKPDSTALSGHGSQSGKTLVSVRGRRGHAEHGHAGELAAEPQPIAPSAAG